MNGYSLGSRSELELIGVHPKLVEVVYSAIKITAQDFSVHDGLRTAREQQELVRRGVSKTMNSLHLPQADGYGHAVDLVPYINRQLRWEWEPIYEIASAMAKACTRHGVELIWGAVWDRPFTSLGSTPQDMKKAVREYCDRHPGPDFIDGPHYQLKKA